MDPNEAWLAVALLLERLGGSAEFTVDDVERLRRSGSHVLIAEPFIDPLRTTIALRLATPRVTA